MSKKMSDSIISPSDGDTSEEEEFTKIIPTNNATVVENVDETSNSSTSDYTEVVFYFLSQLQVLNVSTCVFIFCTNYKDMSKKMSDSIISPSDGDTSEEEEFTKIMPTNNATVVENVDETSNSSTSDYTEVVFYFLSQLQVLNVSTCVFIFCTNYKDMSKKMSDSIISPSDGDTSEEEEFTKIMSTNTPCRNFHNFFLKTTRSVISVHILVLVSMRKYIWNHN